MSPAIVVAIPARNEAASIGACLRALADESGTGQHIAAVALFANNCTDGTIAAARSQALPFPLHVVAADLSPERAHIGHARRGATDAAFECVRKMGLDDAVIACTDADSRVAPGWLDALLGAFDGTVDAVCGAIDLDGPLAPALSERLASEAAYAAVLARMADSMDPIRHDPWPNHIWSWGANIALRASVLAAVGGTPLVALAEDRALHAALLLHDIPIRHSLEVRVRTSSRMHGRAPGGLADLMQTYALDRLALADFALEPAALAWERAQRRGIARAKFGNSGGFGAWWAALEADDPRLQPQRVALVDIPAETVRLKDRLSAAERRSDTPASADASAIPLRAPTLK